MCWPWPHEKLRQIQEMGPVFFSGVALDPPKELLGFGSLFFFFFPRVFLEFG